MKLFVRTTRVLILLTAVTCTWKISFGSEGASSADSSAQAPRKLLSLHIAYHKQSYGDGTYKDINRPLSKLKI